MPSSQFSYIPQVMSLILDKPRQSILDVGPGFGKYGVLCREYCDLIPAWFENKKDGFDKKNWQVKIDCIEPFKGYITPLHEYIYDHIYIGKAEDLTFGVGEYDLILAIGVIEHLDKETGISMLKNCIAKAKAIIIVTPNGFRPQKAEWNNPLEEHKSGWTVEDFKTLGFGLVQVLPNNKILAYKWT